jgi:hypothetical protein
MLSRTLVENISSAQIHAYQFTSCKKHELGVIFFQILQRYCLEHSNISTEITNQT